MKSNNIIINFYNKINYFIFLNNFFYNFNQNFANIFKITNTYLFVNNSKLIFFLNIFKNYKFLQKSSFIFFFIKNNIDIPVCFKKLKSLKSITNEILILKFINFLMKQGQKEKIIKQFFQSFLLFYTNIKVINFNFLYYLFIFNTVYKFCFSNNFFFFNLHSNFNLNFNSIINNDNKILNKNFYLKTLFKNKILKLQPIFSYFILKIDKNIRKYSKGKSGKYKFIWKFIPFYKRTKIIFKFFIKDIKFNYSKTFKNRILNFLLLLHFNYKTSFALKSKIFSYNYIYKNFKKSLLFNFKTIF